MDEPTARVSRRGLFAALALTIVALPLLLVSGLGQATDESTPPADPTLTAAAAPPPKGVSLAPTDAGATPPTSDASSDDTPPATRAVTPSPTPTAVAPEAVDSDAPPPPVRQTASFEEGQASAADLAEGSCNHRTIAFETVVRVTNVTSGASTTCIVTGRGPYVAGRIIELDRTVFGEVAASGAAVVTVRIEW